MSVTAEIMKGDSRVYDKLDRYNDDWPCWETYTFSDPVEYRDFLKKLSDENGCVSVRNVRYK